MSAQQHQQVAAPAHALETEVEAPRQAILATDEELATYQTQAAKIRFLATKTTQRGAIAKRLGIRYQWVRNVLEQPLKKN